MFPPPQGTDQDARRRRAALGGDGDGEAPDASGDDEEHVARAYAAQRLLDGSQVIFKAYNGSDFNYSSRR